MRMVTADNLSYVFVRTSKVLGVKLPKNLIFDSQKRSLSRFSALRISVRDRTRTQTGPKGAFYCEKYFKSCFKLASSCTDDEITNLPTKNLKIANISECVGGIKNSNKNSKLSSDFASKGI